MERWDVSDAALSASREPASCGRVARARRAGWSLVAALLAASVLATMPASAQQQTMPVTKQRARAPTTTESAGAIDTTGQAAGARNLTTTRATTRRGTITLAGTPGFVRAGNSYATTGEWRLPGGTPQGTRFSALDQITTQNVSNLKEVWNYDDGIKDGHEGQPLVVGNTMYMVTPFPNKLIAFDLTKPGPAVKWVYDGHPDQAAAGKACCDTVNRGASYWNGLIIYNLLDNTTVAVDAKTGKERWRAKLGDVNKGETMTMAAFVANGKVFVGVSGGEMGVHGWLQALDANTGRRLWRAYSTGPDDQTLMTRNFHPYYAWMQGKDMGASSWQGDQWKIGGGAPWGWVTYDPETNMVFYSTSNPGTWNPDLRPGDNLWSSSVIARDANTGQARWAYQFTPHDQWDYDGVNESILADIPVNGQPHKVLVHFDRNGFAYTIDRTNGQVLVAQPYQEVNWAKGVDLQTGRPMADPQYATHHGALTKGVCPSSMGARDQQPAAFDPQTGYFYTGSMDICMDYGGVEAHYIAGTPYVGAAVIMYAGKGGNDARGRFLAWDASTGKEVWGINERFPVWSGVLATKGGVVFYGTEDGWFKAVDAKSGDVLWKTHFDSGIIGNPITFLGPDGKQYVAIYSGVGGWYGAVALGLSTDDPWAALGAVGAGQDLPQYTKPGGMLHVFALSQ